MLHPERAFRTGLLLIAFGAVLPWRPLHGQQSATAAIRELSITGMVLDAHTAQPLAGTRVTAQSTAPPAGSSPGACGPAPGKHGRTTTADADGQYAFGTLAPGRYHLTLQRLGYHPASLHVDLCGSTAFQVSVAMRVAPIVLEPIRVTASGGHWGWGAEAPARARTRDGRVAVERRRQSTHLESDVRTLTRTDVSEAVTLAQPDLFRALQRLPGVAIRDDYSAELWTRGAPWDQTSVTFDGVPLFNPLHAAGGFSAINTDAVGSVLFHPGAQPLSGISGGAGLVDIRSRRGGGDGEVNVVTDLSLISGSVALDQVLPSGRAAWMVSGRRTHLDLLSRGLGGADSDFPYAFSDVVGRFDYRIDDERRIEVSGIHEQDRLNGEIPDVVRKAFGSWGTRAGRITYVGRLAGGRVRQTLGTSRFAVTVTPWDSTAPADPATGYFPTAQGSFRAQPVDNAVVYGFLEGGWSRETASGGRQWETGYRLVSQGARYRTEGPWPYRRDTQPAEFEQHLRYGVVWGEGKSRPFSPLTLQAGLRGEFGGSPSGAAPLRLAPRGSARLQLGRSLGVSAALGRTYQYLQAITPGGPGLGAVAMSGMFWVLAGDTIPAIRADIATLGTEWWAAESVLLSATVYGRRAVGMAVPDPRGGVLEDQRLWIPGENHAHGAEFSARKLKGPWTGSLAYSFNESEVETGLRRVSAPWERHSTLGATLVVQVVPSVRVGGAYTHTSGAPITRYWEMYAFECGNGCRWRYSPQAGPAAESRSPAYQSLALQASWEHSFENWAISARRRSRSARLGGR